MKTWRVELTVGGKSLAEIKIQRGIFQGYVLSPLLFIIAMMPLNHILKKCTAVSGTCLYNCLTSTCFLWASLLHRIQPVHRSR